MAAMREQWWKGGVIYQVYPRSFKDTNGDGVGDLRGITEKLSYIASLGVDGVWISPFFTSPMRDFGYDVSDYYGIDPLFGTMDDFDALMAEAQRLGLKILIDLVLNHTSTEHPWFRESRKSKTNPYADYYVWADAKADGSPPNNWLSIFGGSAWQWDSSRKQYFLHNFLSSQADLNFHTPQVQEEVLKVAEFWLKKGVNGFRLDTVNFYFHDLLLRNNPPMPAWESRNEVPDVNPYGMQRHVYDKSRRENPAFLERLRGVMDRFPETTLVGEIGDDFPIPLMAEYTKGRRRLHMAYTFSLLGKPFSPSYIHQVIMEHEAVLGSGWPCWAFSNHDVVRSISRWGAGADKAQLAKMLLVLLGTLRGSICIYQGEELALPEADIAYNEIQDPYGREFWPEYKGRDGCRTPMPWAADEVHGGFSGHKPWLPVAEAHIARAVDVQERDAQSVLHFYRHFLARRKQEPVLKHGKLQLIDAGEAILAYKREDDKKALLVVCNVTENAQQCDLGSAEPKSAVEDFGLGVELRGNVLHLAPFSAAWVEVGKA